MTEVLAVMNVALVVVADKVTKEEALIIVLESSPVEIYLIFRDLLGAPTISWLVTFVIVFYTV